MNNITAKDLMIGDIVDVHRSECVADGGHYMEWNEYGKVVSITEDYITIKYNGREDDYGFEDVEEKDIEPIPITAEIMEKNFTFDPYGFYFFGGDYNEFYIKECANGLWRVEADEIMSGLPIWKMFVSNLHELQHAMRLVGIDKEIEL